MERKERNTKFKPYDLWKDLKRFKANITIGQLLETSLVVRKALKDGLPVARRAKSPMKKIIFCPRW